jgi:FG-GAP-like repeat/FG-GAP repeat
VATQGLIFNCPDRTVGRNLRYQFQQIALFVLVVLASMPFLASGAFQPIQFARPINFDFGNGPVDRLCAADFNGDGFPDLAVGYRSNLLYVAVLTNSGTGTMQLWTNFPAQGALSAGDFNGDHKMDLVTVGVGSGATVWLNNGNGAFTGTNINSQYAYGSSVAVGDFNRDQKPDLAIGGVFIFLGQGNGTFTFLTNYPAGGTAIAMADFDGNTRLDLATVRYDLSYISVLLGNGNGTFATPTNYADNTGYYRYSVAAGDFNSDGKPDLLSGNGYESLSLHLNNGDGTFGPQQTVQLPILVSALGVADFNGDGNLDIVAGNPLLILPGNGDGTFASPLTNLSSLSLGGANQSLVVADFDGYGRPDIATCSVTNNCVSILLNRTPPPVSIGIQNTSGLLVLNWADKPGFGLEFTTNLGLPNSWSAVTNPSFVVNGQRIVVTTAASGSGFFRLRKP